MNCEVLLEVILIPTPSTCFAFLLSFLRQANFSPEILKVQRSVFSSFHAVRVLPSI